jgi:hypothetical protein
MSFLHPKSNEKKPSAKKSASVKPQSIKPKADGSKKLSYAEKAERDLQEHSKLAKFKKEKGVKVNNGNE